MSPDRDMRDWQKAKEIRSMALSSVALSSSAALTNGSVCESEVSLEFKLVKVI